MNTLSNKAVSAIALLVLTGATAFQAEDLENKDNQVYTSSSGIKAIESVSDNVLDSSSDVEFETTSGIHIVDSEGTRVEAINGKSVREIEQEEIDIKNKKIEEELLLKEKAAEEERLAEEEKLAEEERLAEAAKVEAEKAKLTNEDIAKKVIAGKFGNGKERIRNVESEGYNYKEVQSHVVKLTDKKDIKKAVTAKSVEKKDVTQSSQSKPEPTPSSQTTGEYSVMQATGYSTAQPNLSQFTANGTDLLQNPRVIAVDPSVIPLGTVVEIEGYGRYTAADTGGAIKGNRIDIHFQTVSEAMSFGRRDVKLRIVN